MNGGKHTAGPWKVEIIGNPRVLAASAKGGDFPICDVRGWGYLTGKGHGALGLPHDEAVAIQNANTHLIAAAPDLLAELKRLSLAYVGLLESGRDRIMSLGGQCDPVDVMESGDPSLKSAKAAIAKAEGRAP